MSIELNKDPRVTKYIFRDDGIFPNNEELPVLIYKHVFRLPEWSLRAASLVERKFRENDWSDAWRDVIYNYHHYHSISHEVLGIYRGKAELQFGGAKGLITTVEKGDVILIPAGVAHKCISESQLKCVGAYPEGMDYDMNYGSESERPKAMRNINKLPLPRLDPVFGKQGPLHSYWRGRIKLLRRMVKLHHKKS